MGRAEIQIDMDKLRACIQAAEAAGPLPNRSKLYEDVTERMIQMGEHTCNPQLVGLRIAKYDIAIVTPKGKKGRTKGDNLGMSIPRSKRKMARNVYEAVSRATPKKFRKILNRAANGSMKARVILGCLECSNYQPKEIKFCGCLSCPFYDIRPYRTTEEKLNGGGS